MSLSFVLLRGRSTLKTTLVSGLTFPTHMNVWVEDVLNENLNVSGFTAQLSHSGGSSETRARCQRRLSDGRRRKCAACQVKF